MENISQKEKIKALLSAKQPVTISSMAKELGCTALQAAHLLPEEMRSFAPGEEFEKVWLALCQWPKATFICVHKGNVIEVGAKLSPGKFAMGFYNIMGGKSALEGHFKTDSIVEIGFISMPFMGRESHFVAFFDQQGESVYDIYVGRENHILIESAKLSFINLQQQYRK